VFGGNIGDVYFFNKFEGVATVGYFYRTTDGGFSWTQSVSSVTGGKLDFISDSVGWAGYNLIYIPKTTNSGITWFLQTTNISNPSVSAVDTLKAWAGGGGLVHTTDGGGPPAGILYAGNNAEGYKLNQNFPNPFNAVTIIFFELKEKSSVELKIYNILGEEVSELIDDDHYTAGVYQFGFDGDKEGLASGVYFYRIIAKSETSNAVFIDTKKMVLLK
jgi:hypothetical protein